MVYNFSLSDYNSFQGKFCFIELRNRIEREAKCLMVKKKFYMNSLIGSSSQAALNTQMKAAIEKSSSINRNGTLSRSSLLNEFPSKLTYRLLLHFQLPRIVIVCYCTHRHTHIYIYTIYSNFSYKRMYDILRVSIISIYDKTV